jgi:uncharacterized Fe-S cluster-containing protein
MRDLARKVKADLVIVRVLKDGPLETSCATTEVFLMQSEAITLGSFFRKE